MKLVRPVLVAFAVLLAACVPAPPTPPPADPGGIHSHPFLVCTRAHESDRGDKNGNGLHDAGYGTDTGNGYYGAFQFDLATWAGAITRAGFPLLAGTPPIWDPEVTGRAWVGVEFQDIGAWQLYLERGNQPWGGRC